MERVRADGPLPGWDALCPAWLAKNVPEKLVVALADVFALWSVRVVGTAGYLTLLLR